MTIFVVSVHAFSAPSNLGGRSPQQGDTSGVSVGSSAATRHKSPATKSKVGDMLPSRMYRRVRLTKAATHRLSKVVQSAAIGKGGKGQPLQVGVARALSLDPMTQGVWFDLGDAGRAAMLGIISEGAVQVRVQFVGTNLLPGAKLFVRSMNDPDEVYGVFDSRGAPGDGEFWSPPVRGEGVVIEYIEPQMARSNRRRKKIPPFRIVQISHIFRE